MKTRNKRFNEWISAGGNPAALGCERCEHLEECLRTAYGVLLMMLNAFPGAVDKDNAARLLQQMRDALGIEA